MSTKAEVKMRYGNLARGGEGCCSDGSCCPNLTSYDTETLKEIPEEAANLSLGCGNPVALASLKEGEVVLDIGSGSGIDLFYASKKIGPQGRAIGLDMTSAMIQRAEGIARTHGYKNVEFRLGDAEDMPIEDESIDVIISNCVMNLTTDKRKVYQEAYRVLRPGGRIVISDIVTDREFPSIVKDNPDLWAGCVAGALPENEYLRIISDAGFRDIHMGTKARFTDLRGIEVYSITIEAKKA